jgi:outer membrane protein assembly factor BamB
MALENENAPPSRSPYRDAEAHPIIVTIHRNLHALSPETGAVLWSRDDGAFSGRFLLHHGSVIYANADHVLFVNARTGVVHQRVKNPASIAPDNVILVAERLIFGGSGEVFCVSLDGKVLWHNPLRGTGFGPVGLGVPGDVRFPDLR